jgi:hypothetical protein
LIATRPCPSTVVFQAKNPSPAHHQPQDRLEEQDADEHGADSDQREIDRELPQRDVVDELGHFPRPSRDAAETRGD